MPKKPEPQVAVRGLRFEPTRSLNSNIESPNVSNISRSNPMIILGGFETLDSG